MCRICIAIKVRGHYMSQYSAFVPNPQSQCKSYSLQVSLLQDDGGKKIELKPGFYMEHDENVSYCFDNMLLL